MVLGTPLYMSPEQYSGDELDGQTDVYSLGVMLHEALAGRPPFRGHNWGELAAMHLRDEPPPLGPLRPETPAEVQELARQMMAKAPAERPLMIQVVAAFDRLLEDLLLEDNDRTVPAELLDPRVLSISAEFERLSRPSPSDRTTPATSLPSTTEPSAPATTAGRRGAPLGLLNRWGTPAPLLMLAVLTLVVWIAVFRLVRKPAPAVPVREARAPAAAVLPAPPVPPPPTIAVPGPEQPRPKPPDRAKAAPKAPPHRPRPSAPPRPSRPEPESPDPDEKIDIPIIRY